MIKSMTGYGESSMENEKFFLKMEIRTLNSKYLDVSVKISKAFYDKEIEIKNIAGERLTRGKISVDVDLQSKGEPISMIEFNRNLFKTYYDKLKHLADSVVGSYDDLFKIAIQYPDVMISKTSEEHVEQGWELIKKGLLKACDQCNDFRRKEGKTLKKNLEIYISNIQKYLEEISRLDENRIEKIKNRIRDNVKDVINQEEIDDNRFEQELIYYVEKLDISEEKTRLKSHLDYFQEVINQEEASGKKLSFISQEIGREINTIGAKANDADIQKIVVNMKDELEKIKEQLANIV